jgi:hypothetical protein
MFMRNINGILKDKGPLYKFKKKKKFFENREFYMRIFGESATSIGDLEGI